MEKHIQKGSKRFKHMPTLLNRFWKSWISDYLIELRERKKYLQIERKRNKIRRTSINKQ